MPKRLDTKEFIKRAREVHGPFYNYSKVVYKNYNEKVEIICGNKSHGSFLQSPKHHLSGHGCPICGKSKKLTKKDLVQRAQSVHGNKYNYTKADYKNIDTPIEIICSEHGSFFQSPYAHISMKQGCPICALRKSSETKRNNGTYKKVAKEVFEKRKMNGTLNTSKYEEYVWKKLLQIFTVVERNYNSDPRYPFHVDFYVPERDLFLELNINWTHGFSWYDPSSKEDLDKRSYIEKKYPKWCPMAWWTSDVQKREFAKKNNLNYVVLWNSKDIEEWFLKNCPNGTDWGSASSWRCNNV